MSVASTTLLENIVVRVRSWEVGACVVAAAALLSRAAEDGHRVVPRADLRIAADDAAEDEDKLAMMDDDEDSGGVAAAAGAAAGVVGARDHRRPGLGNRRLVLATGAGRRGGQLFLLLLDLGTG